MHRGEPTLLKQPGRLLMSCAVKSIPCYPVHRPGDKILETPDPEIKLGDVVRLRKRHPCGSYDWEVVRLGTDIGIECLKCHRKVLLEREVFERRVREIQKGKNN